MKKKAKKKPSNIEHRLLIVFGSIEADLQPPAASYAEVLKQARAHRREDPKGQDGLHYVHIDWRKRTIGIGDFSGGEIADEEM